MEEINVTLAEMPSLGRIWLCGCNSIHLSIGPVTVTLAPEAFVQTASLVRHAMEQLAVIVAAKEVTGDPLQDFNLHHTRFTN